MKIFLFQFNSTRNLEFEMWRHLDTKQKSNTEFSPCCFIVTCWQHSAVAAVHAISLNLELLETETH